MTEEVLIGRQEILSTVRRAMDRGRNIIVFGEEGVGKTALVHRALAERNPDFMLFSAASATLKESLINFICDARKGREDIKGKNILSLKKAFYPILARRPKYIIFDHLGRVGPRFCGFFEYLMDREIPILVVCRGVTDKEVGHLGAWLLDFEKVEVLNLDHGNAVALVQACAREQGLDLPRENDFVKNVWYFSKGNPKVIKALCALAADDKYGRNGAMDVKLMDLDRRIREIIGQAVS